MFKPRSGNAESQEQKQDVDPKRHPWANYPLGSSVTFTMTVDGHGHAMTGTHTETLKDIGKGSCTITTTHAMRGHARESDRVEDFPTEVGKETLKIDGTDYPCSVWSGKSKRDDGESTTKIWLTDSIKTPLKIETREGGETYVLVAVKVGVKITAEGKDYDCTNFEGEMSTERGRAKAKVWMNSEVPGMKVKSELDLGGEMKKVLELKELKIAK